MKLTPSLLQQLAQHVECNYHDCQIRRSGDRLELRRPLGRVQIDAHGLIFYVGDALWDEIASADVEDPFSEVDAFLLMLTESEESCTPIYTTAVRNAARCGSRIYYAVFALTLLLLLGCRLLHLPPLFLLIGLLLPLLLLLPLRLFRRRSLQRDWVCPHCAAALPLRPKEWVVQPAFVSRCPHCGASLVDDALAAAMVHRLADDEDDTEEADTPLDPAAFVTRGDKRLCRLSGLFLLCFALLFGLLLLGTTENMVPAMIAVHTAAFLSITGIAAAVLVCRAPKEVLSSAPAAVVREQKWISWLGVATALTGLVFSFLALVISPQENTQPVFVLLLTVSGLALLAVGGWMLLARRNRTLYALHSSLIYISSFGRKREFPAAQISSFTLTSSGSIRFFDADARKLCAIETNMAGIDGLLGWLAGHDIAITTPESAPAETDKRKEKLPTPNKSPAGIWREEDETPLHRHLKALRAVLLLVLLLFAAGCLLPLPLYLYTDLKAAHAIYLATFSPLPMVLYCLVVSPVLLLEEPPAKATAAWTAMHIRFPVRPVLLLSLLGALQVFYFWAGNFLQIVHTGRFYLLYLALVAVVVTLFFLRTPQRLRSGVGAFLMLFLLLGYLLTYGTVVAAARPVEHYPAVVTERTGPTDDDPSAKRTVTVRLDDGTTGTLQVSESLQQLEEAGAPLVVCQKDSVLGIRLVRLHLPPDVDISTLPHVSQPDSTDGGRK